MDISFDDPNKKIKAYWLEFINGQVNHNPGIREDIFESWLRCRKWGVSPYLTTAPKVFDEKVLEKELERKKELISVATPVIEDLYSVIKGSSSGIWLANEKGVILTRTADHDLVELEEVLNTGFKEGFDWSEKAMGTNAVGTALMLKRYIQISLAEHYCEMAHNGVCAAAPILDPEGEIIGILDITSYNEKNNPLTVGMVVAGVGAIQRELQLKAMHQEITLSHNYIMEMIESLPSGIIVINPKGIITNINRNACLMLGFPAEKFFKRDIFETLGRVDCIKSTLKTGKELEETEYYYEKENEKLHFTICCRAIKNPKGDIDGAVIILREIETVRRLTSRMAGYKARFSFKNIVGEDPAFKKVISQAEAAAYVSSNVLILGESGTGKEVLAQAIHSASRLSSGPFVAINCGALPRELIGSELFGYEEGAFTGAKKGGSPGKFELANNGTLFLDEIGDMPLDLQLMLLRVLQERVVVRLGGRQEISVNVRIIAATNKDIQQMIVNGLFRQDLYYRLNVVTLNLPPLRQRKGDIAILAKHFLKIQSERMGKEINELSPQTLLELERYNWPGNIRELENSIERAVIFSNEQILRIESLDTLIGVKRDHFDEYVKKHKTKSIMSIEKALIYSVLNECNNNITRAAEILGITRPTMYRKLRKYEL